MFYIIIISLSLFTIGIFFIPFNILFVVTAILFIMVIIFHFKKIKTFLKSLGMLSLILIPVFLLQIITHRQGVIWQLGRIKIYSEGFYHGLEAVLRVFSIFMMSYLMLKVWFPIDKYKEKYKHVTVFQIIILAIDIFPSLMKLLGGTIKTAIISGKREPHKIEKILELIDQSYQDLINQNLSLTKNNFEL